MPASDATGGSLYTVAEVAKRLKVSARLVYRLVETGELACYRIASAIRVAEEDMQAYLAACKDSRHHLAPRTTTQLRRLRI